MNEARRLLKAILDLNEMDTIILPVDMTIAISEYLCKPEPPQEPTTPSERDRLAEKWMDRMMESKDLVKPTYFEEWAITAYRAADAFLKAGEKGE